ncbi:hypothetical protein AMATHDRAFT_54630 [Amanita thiersii Skay4041]|uniref:Major facilitator superfamily (MFS) profile domain-containing protein n=1 Tax=Amanita thiersii Skay4041 TaxID=703135 RepID=A0A2A9NZT5_9AGAR|nr:hypothetical protein AMATHDRAFT_54630 [Amanita thiersii Skay4041]
MTGFGAISVEEDEDDRQRFKGVSRILGPPWAHLPTLTVGLLGVQIFWSVEMSYASPYLLSLGLSKSSMAIVFVAGPLSGLIMQPLIGMLADNSTSRFGRRRPYMLLGTVVCMFAMLLLGFTRPIASIFTETTSNANDILTIWLAVFAIYLIDFSINAVQAVDRALLVDTLPPFVQPAGNAWAARMLGIGSVIGFFVGNINLPTILPFLGQTQLEVLTVIVSLLLLGGHIMMALLVKERVLLKDNGLGVRRKSFLKELKETWHGMLTLPPRIRQICIIQFSAWLAWFPVLFYTTIYIGDIHKNAILASSVSPLSSQERAELDAEATRLGSRALFYSALVSLFGNVVLPYFVYGADCVDECHGRGKGRDPQELHLDTDGAAPSIHQTLPTADHAKRGWLRFPWRMLTSFRVPQKLKIHLATLWGISHLVVAGCMFGTFITSSVFGASLLITITGFSWAITQWAPFSLLAEAILTEPSPTDFTSSISLTDTRTRLNRPEEREAFLASSQGNTDMDEEEHLEANDNQMRIMASSAARISRIDVSHNNFDMDELADGVSYTNEENTSKGLSSKAGIILGIHNIFIVVPQFLVTGLSAVVFAIFDPSKSVLPTHHGAAHGAGGAPGAPTNITVGDASVATRAYIRDIFLYRDDIGVELGPGDQKSNPVVYIFRLGGLAATIAWILCWRLSRELRHRGL